MSSSFGISWFVLLMLLLLHTGASTSDIDVCGANTSLPSVPLHGLATFLAKNSSITVVLCNGNSFLDGELIFTGKKAVRFVGEKASVLTCRGEFAGISYYNVYHVEISSITFKNCGSMHWENASTVSSSILIQNSSKIFVSNCSVLDSHGLGIVIFQSYAVINIIDCTFKNCSPNHSTCGGGGLFVELRCFQNTHHPDCNGLRMTMSINNTTFQYNNASLSLLQNSTCRNHAFLSGSGLNLNLYGNTSNNQIAIHDCILESNTALLWGGGLNIVIANTSSRNNITVTNTTIYRNKCTWKGGGGADIGILSNHVTKFPEYNKILFINTTFEKNSATIGGGVIIYSTVVELHQFETNKVTFMNCHWIDNVARYASALYLTLHNEKVYNNAGLLPKVTLEDCIFRGNQVLSYNFLYHDSFPAPAHKRGKGCLFSIGYKVTFTSSMQFVNNSGSALYLASSIVYITGGSELSFFDNSGHYGGAISLFGTSLLHLRGDVVLNFINNTATMKGGAIYQDYIDTLELISLIKCFFYYRVRKEEANINIMYIFRNNRIANGVSYSVSSLNGSIHMHSLKSCEGLIDFTPKNSINGTMEFRGPVARFVFQNITSPGEKVITTAVRKFRITMNITGDLLFVPGKVTQLPIEVTDDFKRTTVGVYQATLLRSDHNFHDISLPSDYTHIQ